MQKINQKDIKVSFLLMIIAFFVITFIVFGDYIILKLAYYFKDIGSDTVNDLLPSYFHNKNLEAVDGNFHTWSFFKGMGEPAVKYIILNPIHFLAILWKKIAGENFWIYRYFGILNVSVLVLIGAWAYLKTMGFGGITATIGSLSVVFSGYFIVGSVWNHHILILKLIFLLFAYEQWLKKDRWIFLPFAVHYLSANYFYTASAAIFMLFYSLARYYDEKGNLKGYIPLHLKMAAIALLAILANLINSAPILDKMINSPRVNGPANLSAQLLHNPENIDGYLRNVTLILRFFSNDLLGTGTDFRGWYNYLEAPLFYFGLINLILFPISFLFFNKKQKIVYGALVALAIIVAFIPLVRHTFNFFIGNYYKGTVDFFIPLFLLLPALKAFEAIPSNKKFNFIVLILVIGILLIFLHFPYFKENEIIDFNLKLKISLFLLIYALLLVFYAKNESLKYALLSVFVIELIFLTKISVHNRDAYLFSELKNTLAGYNDGTVQALKFIRSIDNESFFRIEKDYSSGKSLHASLNDAMVQGYYGTTRYSSFNQKFYIKFLMSVGLIKKGSEAQTRWARGVRGVPLLMTFASVKYFLARDKNTPLIHSGYDTIATVNDILILKNKYFLPLGYSYRKILKVSDFQKLSFFKKQVALLSACIVEDSSATQFEEFAYLDTADLPSIKTFNFKIYDSLISSLKADTLSLISFRNSQFVGKILTNRPIILFFSIPYDKGWHIEANGKSVKTFLLNTGFVGIKLGKGNYELKIYYMPYYRKASIGITILAGILLIGIFVFRFIKYRKF